MSLKRDWHFFWFSSWKCALKEIPYHDLIDVFVVWDDLIREIEMTKRTDCVVVRGGCETFEQHDSLFYPIPSAHRDVDIIYIARFIRPKRPDVALKCVRYVTQRRPSCRTLFLESKASDPEMRKWVRDEIVRLGLSDNVSIRSVPLAEVNSCLNRARVSLFTSDEEGVCRAVLQSLLAERPLLCYRNTQALTRHFYDERYFHFYDYQDEEYVGRAALELLTGPNTTNPGARQYVLGEKGLKFYDLAGWQADVLRAAEPIYLREGQELDPNDILPPSELTLSQFWRPFELTD
jgi:glycosyltransferase involved in cell wall biosynthesis